MGICKVHSPLDEWQTKSQPFFTTSIIQCTWELSVFSIAFIVSERKELYTAFTEVKRQTTCAHSTTPSSPLRDSLIQTLLGTPSLWCSTMSPHLWTRHCSPITQRERWDSTAPGEKYTFFLRYWRRTKIESDQQTQPQSRSGKKAFSSQISLVSCTNNLSLLGDREEIL